MGGMGGKPTPLGKTMGAGHASPGTPSSASGGGAQTPSWLKGTYRAATPASPHPQPTTVESWCKQRVDSISATVDGTSDALPELRKVMESLDYGKIEKEIEVVCAIRKEFWKARERQRKAASDLRRVEREVQRNDSHAAHINGKIARLRSYARFIDAGWIHENEDDVEVTDIQQADRAQHQTAPDGPGADKGLPADSKSNGPEAANTTAVPAPKADIEMRPVHAAGT